MGQRGTYIANHAIVFSLIKQYLLSVEKYEYYRDKLLTQKFRSAFWAYNHVLPGFKSQVKQNIRETIDDDEIAFIKEGKNLNGSMYYFYLGLLSLKPGRLAFLPQIYCSMILLLKKINRTVMRPLENLFRWIQEKLMKTPQPVKKESNPAAERQIEQLSELVCRLSKEVVELRKQSRHDSTKKWTA